MVTTLLVVRHTQALGNIQKTFQGHIDTDISEAGAVQLELLSERFRSVHIDAICSSPLLRARRTAEAINRTHHLPIELLPALIEIDAGGFEGRRWDELPTLYPETFETWCSDLPHFIAPDGESCAQVYDRISRAALDIAARYAKKTVAVVSHGCAIKNLLCWASGKPLSDIASIPWINNTAVSRIDFDDALCPTVVYMDDHAHLNGVELPQPAYWDER